MTLNKENKENKPKLSEQDNLKLKNILYNNITNTNNNDNTLPIQKVIGTESSKTIDFEKKALNEIKDFRKWNILLIILINLDYKEFKNLFDQTNKPINQNSQNKVLSLIQNNVQSIQNNINSNLINNINNNHHTVNNKINSKIRNPNISNVTNVSITKDNSSYDIIYKNTALYEALYKSIKSIKFSIYNILDDQIQNPFSKNILSISDNLGINIKEVQNEFLINSYISKSLEELIFSQGFIEKYDELNYNNNYFLSEDFYTYQLLLQKVLFELELHTKSTKKIKTLFCLKDLDDSQYYINEFFFVNYIVFNSYNADRIYNVKFLLKTLNIDKKINHALYVDYKIIFYLSNLDCKRKLEFLKKFIKMLMIEPDFLIKVTSRFQRDFKISEQSYLFVKNFEITSMKKGLSKDKQQKIEKMFANIISYFK